MHLLKLVLVSFLFSFSGLALSDSINIKPGMDIATPTPFATPTPATVKVTEHGQAAEEATPTPAPEDEDTRTWNEKLAGIKAAPKAAKPAGPTPEELEAETKRMEAELAEVQKEIQEKGPTAIITNPEFAKKVMRAMGGDKKNAKSPFAGVSDDEIKSLIKLRVQGTPISQVLIDYPKTLTFIVRFFKDDRAFLSLMKISTQEKKLKVYMAVVIFLILLSFLFNLVGSKTAPFWKRFLRKLVVTIFIMVCQFGAVYYFFHEELDPTIQIAKSVFFT